MMSDIQVQCRYCQKEFTVSKDLGGLLATCPYCSRQVNVPMAPDRMSVKSGLQVCKGTSVSGGRCCPKCGAVMGADAVICIQCGYDQRSGLQFSGKPETKGRKSWLMALTGLVILGGLAWTLFKPEKDTVLSAPPDTSRDSIGSSVAPAPPTPEPVIEAADENVSTTVDTNAPAAPVEADAGRSEEEVRRAEDELRAWLTQQLVQTHPVFTNGEFVAIRRTSGMVQRGVYLGINSNTVVLMADGHPTRIPLAVLDHPSRLRSDVAAREKFIEYQMKKRTAGSNSP